MFQERWKTMIKKDLLNRANCGVIYLGKNAKANISESYKVLLTFEEPTMLAAKELFEKELFKKGLIIIEANNQLEKWCGILETCCLRYGKDYIDSLAFEVISKAEKKLAVMYGNCQMHDYYDCMVLSVDFCKDYNAVYFKYLEYPRWKEERLELLLSYSNLLICTKEGFDERFRNCCKFVKIHNPACRIIEIPTYSFRGYFPQTNSHIQEKGTYDIVAEVFNSFHREDMVINKMIHQGLKEDEIVLNIMNGHSFNPKDILICNEIALKQIELMDRNSDISIGKYVKENYRKHRLFKDPVHMENELVWYITKQLLNLLGYSQEEDSPSWTIHYFTEIPIYPEVKKALCLEWPEDEYNLEIRLNQGMIISDLEGYVRRYCRFAASAETIKNSLYIQSETDRIKEWFPNYAP